MAIPAAHSCGDVVKLMKQIEKYFEDWRGQVPDPALFQPSEEIPCFLCVEQRARAPHVFARSECNDTVQRYILTNPVSSATPNLIAIMRVVFVFNHLEDCWAGGML
jgi:hypothetical protein